MSHIDNQTLETAIAKAKFCVLKYIGEHETKIADLVLRVADQHIYPWSQQSLVATYQKLYVTQAALCRIYMDFQISGEYWMDISPVSVQLRCLTSNNRDLPDAREIRTSSSSRPNIHFFTDPKNFFGVTQDDVQSLIEKFWRQYDEYTSSNSALSVLGLDSDASWEDIQAQYRRLAATHHPDKGGDPLSFVRVKEAYDDLRWKKPSNT